MNHGRPVSKAHGFVYGTAKQRSLKESEFNFSTYVCQPYFENTKSSHSLALNSKLYHRKEQTVSIQVKVKSGGPTTASNAFSPWFLQHDCLSLCFSDLISFSLSQLCFPLIGVGGPKIQHAVFIYFLLHLPSKSTQLPDPWSTTILLMTLRCLSPSPHF